MKRLTKLQLAKELLRSRNYLLVTDKQAVMDIKRSGSIQDEVFEAYLMSDLEQFKTAIDEQIEALNKAKKPAHKKRSK